MISTRGRYAIRIMVDLAKLNEGTCSPLREIAKRQDLSKKYLEIIVKDLVQGGLIVGSAGKNGGYKLSRRPDEYTVGEILELMESRLAPVACLAKDAKICPKKETCPTLPMWQEYDRLVRDFFFGKKLSDLVN